MLFATIVWSTLDIVRGSVWVRPCACGRAPKLAGYAHPLIPHLWGCLKLELAKQKPKGFNATPSRNNAGDVPAAKETT